VSRRIEGIRRGARRRRRTLLAAIVSIGALGIFAISALAVHDLAFQLDGDVVTTPDTNVGGNTQTIDWEDLFDASGNELALPTDFTASTFHKDFNNTGTTFLTNDATTFATGSKDTLPITPGWQCNFDANVNSKIDVMNGYAAAYTDPVSGDDILYFALERNINTGDANVGFWFLQDEVSCDSTAGNQPFVGDHSDGDLLIVSAFTKGGTVSTIDVYQWVGGASGALDPDPVAHGADCKTTAGGVTACATVNTGTITTPWLTSNKQDGVGHSLRISEFFEGGLNLTEANLAGQCFNTFMADTRSSQSLTATLFDFSLGKLGVCESSITTTPKDSGGNDLTETDIPATGTLEVKDSADILVTGVDTFDATVTFHLCGPAELTSATDVCDTGGVQIGNPVPVTANGTVTSDSAFLTSAGRYCWRGDFSGDDSIGVLPASDSSEGECFTVNPLQPTLTTQVAAGTVPFGGSITDTVSLTGTADQEGTNGPALEPTINADRGAPADGTIHVDVYGPDSCDAADIVFSEDIPVSGDGDYLTTPFTPTAPGVYVFVASYSGDDPNTLGVDATPCADQPATEKVTVEQIGTDIRTKQSWYPNDTTEVSAEAGNLGTGGSVLFELYDNATCDGTALYTETVDLTGGVASEEVSTSNTSFAITTGYNDPADSVTGPYSWRVTYTPDVTDASHTGSRSTCDSEHFAITYTNDPGPGTDLP
jgi:hypothetical protein